MNDLTKKITEIFNESLEVITSDSSCALHSLISDNLITDITCNYGLCSDHLIGFSNAFNTLLNTSQKNSHYKIKAFISENEDIFQKIESLFLNTQWSTNQRVREFNIATHNTSGCKCTNDNKFYIIKCYDHFYYIYNTESNECLMAVKNEKKALTMINILLLTPYLLYGDLYAVHGGLVSNGKDNILISNSSLGGKTTFALLFLANGWQIITEETTYITKCGKILNYNIRNYFNIRVGTYLEFKDFFVKADIINNSFLAMAHIDKEKLFGLGKEEQMSIDFDALCKNKHHIIVDQITHVLKVSIEKDKSDMYIEKADSMEIVNRFLEVSLAPTVMLFKSLTNMANLKRNIRREELIQMFKNVKSYSVASDFNYREKFNFLMQELNELSPRQ